MTSVVSPPSVFLAPLPAHPLIFNPHVPRFSVFRLFTSDLVRFRLYFVPSSALPPTPSVFNPSPFQY